LGLLNSSLEIKHVNPLYSGRYYIYDRQYLEKFPIIYPQTSEEEDIAFEEAVQQFKNGRKRRANRASNPKRSDFFSAKSNCETASIEVPPDADAERVMREYKGDFEKIEGLKRAIEDLDKSMDELVGGALQVFMSCMSWMRMIGD